MTKIKKREIAIILFTAIIQSMFVYIILHASPITDEYCFASQSREFGVLSSFYSLVNLWSPSLGYLPTLAIFSLPIAGTTISSLLIAISFLVLNVFFFFFGHYLFKPSNKLESIIAYSKIFLIFIIPISIVQTSGYLNYTQLFHNPLAVFKFAFLETFSFDRDGQLLIWVSQISLTWQKNIMSIMILTIPLILTKYIKDLKNRKILLISLSVLFLTYGPNTESYIFVISLFLFSGYRILTRKVDSFLIFVTVVSTLGLLGLSISSGSRNRHTHFANLNLEMVLSRFGTVLIQILVIVSTVFVVSKAISSFLATSFSQSFQEAAQSLKIATRVTVSAGILANLIVGSFVYISTYHWISLTFLIVFWILIESSVSNNQKHSKKFALNFVSFFVVYVMVITIFAGISQSAYIREAGWDARRLENGNSSLKPLPIYDLKGNLIAFDLNVKSASIIPVEGFIEGAAIVCFKKLRRF
jgi:hypothetical protein